MKIKEIRAAAIDISPKLKTTPRVPKVQTEGIGSVMARYLTSNGRPGAIPGSGPPAS